MKSWLSTYFDLSKREFNGLMALMILVLLMEFAPLVYRLFIAEKRHDDLTELKIVRLLLADKKESADVEIKKDHLSKVKHSLFKFDPNTTTQGEWQRLGLSEKQAAAILKYIAKGGNFKKAEDLKKMYTINAKLYKDLFPYVEIAKTGIEKGVQRTARDYKDKKNNFTREINKNALLQITELNAADSAALDGIRGIGPTFANRIIRYRERLGGFYKKEQLMEVFGMDSLKYNEIKAQIVIDVKRLNKININTAVFEDFRNHPYIRYKQVNALIQYRKQHGNYGNIADLNRVAILDEETLIRIAPYLTF